MLATAIPSVAPCINCQQTTVSTTPPAIPVNISPDTGISATTIAGCTGTISFSVTTGLSCFGNTTTVTTIVTHQEKIVNIQVQISVVQNQLNNTIDATVRDSLMAQIAALKTQVDKPQTTSTTISPTP